MGQHHHYYNNKRWHLRRAAQLRAHPLCAECLKKNMVVSANVVDHVEPHRGDAHSFWHGALQSLCKRCHDSRKQGIEHHGYANDIDVDGFPVDTAHPFNRHGGG